MTSYEREPPAASGLRPFSQANKGVGNKRGDDSSTSLKHMAERAIADERADETGRHTLATVNVTLYHNFHYFFYHISTFVFTLRGE